MVAPVKPVKLEFVAFATSMITVDGGTVRSKP